MTKTVKVGEIFYPGIDTDYDVLNISNEFTLEITDTNGNIIENEIIDAEFSEIIMSYEEHSAEVLEDTNSGRKTFKVTNSTLIQGDGIVINGYYYVIDKISIDGITITIKGTLKENLTQGDIVTNCGNTGIYKIPVKISQIGFYFCTIFHKSFGHATIKYKVISNNITDIMNELQTIKDKIDEKQIGFI